MQAAYTPTHHPPTTYTLPPSAAACIMVQGLDWYLIAEQPVPAPDLAHPEGCAALRIVLVTVPRVSRSCEHFPDGFDLHLLQLTTYTLLHRSRVLHLVRSTCLAISGRGLLDHFQFRVHGPGFKVQGSPENQAHLPGLLSDSLTQSLSLTHAHTHSLSLSLSHSLYLPTKAQTPPPGLGRGVHASPFFAFMC